MRHHVWAFLAATSAAALVAGGANAGTNLVTNGSFEQLNPLPQPLPAGVDSFEFGADYIYGQAVTGWTSTGVPNSQAFNIYFNPDHAAKNSTGGPVSPDTQYTPPKSGDVQYLWALPTNADPDKGNFVALDGDPSFDGSLTQTINGLVKGQQYTVSFDWAAAQFADRSGDTTEQLKVGFGSQTASTSVVDNPSGQASNWMTQSFTFTADGKSDVLSFLSIGAPSGLPPVALLDGVSVTAAPEPATWALMIVAAVGFGGALRIARRRDQMIAG